MSDEKKIFRILRHGDVILYKLSSDNQLPEQSKGLLSKIFGERKSPEKTSVANHKNRKVLANGETTGHSHVMEGDFAILEEKKSSDEILFRVDSSAVLTHEEHDRIVLDKGIYLKVTQTEYDPFNDLIRYIRD